MFKLLPEEAREKVRREYILRQSVVVLAGALSVLVIAIALLLPAYVLSNSREKEVKDKIATIGGLEPNAEVVTLRSWLSNINLRLSLLNPKQDTDQPSLSIEKVLNQRVAGIATSEITWMNSEGKVSISGTAADRQALIKFEEKLNASLHFDPVTFPVSNLAKTRDILFKVDLLLKTKP